MQEILQRSILILLTIIGCSIVVLKPVVASSPAISVSQPILPGHYSLPITNRQTASVMVNVTKTNSALNVILYYAAVQGDRAPLEAEYRPLQMKPGWASDSIITYFVDMSPGSPPIANDSWVWGFARAYDNEGNVAGESLERSRIYRYWTPNPHSSILDLSFSIRHVDPKKMTLNMSMTAHLVNYAEYDPEQLQFGSCTVRVDQSGAPFEYYTWGQTCTQYYSYGHPELFPFDGYDFTFYMDVPRYLNQSSLQIAGNSLEAFKVYPDVIPLAQDLTVEERGDNSAWEFHSYVEFRPSHNFTLLQPALRVTVTLQRIPDQVNYLLLYPVVALYALLGFSILLRGGDEIRNRLLVYLNVFVFSYGFQSNIRNLSITPLISGVSMIERTTLALIPCTVLLAVLSILGTALTHWSNAEINVSKVSHMLALDAFGITTAALFVSSIGSVSVRDYLGGVARFGLLNMSWFGGAIFLGLFAGLIINAALVIYVRGRSGTMFLLDGSFATIVIVLVVISLSAGYPDFKAFPYTSFFSALSAASVIVLAWERLAGSRAVQLNQLMKRVYLEEGEIKLQRVLTTICNKVRALRAIETSERNGLSRPVTILDGSGRLRGLDYLYPRKSVQQLRELFVHVDNYNSDHEDLLRRIREFDGGKLEEYADHVLRVLRGVAEMRLEGNSYVPYSKYDGKPCGAWPTLNSDTGRKFNSLVKLLEQEAPFMRAMRSSIWTTAILERASEIRDMFVRFLEQRGIEPPQGYSEDLVGSGVVFDRT